MRSLPPMVTLLAGLVLAPEAAAEPPTGWGVSASYTSLSTSQWSIGTDSGRTAVTGHLMRGNLGLGAGVAVLHSGALQRSTAFEGFGQLRLVGPFDLNAERKLSWWPTIGLELGLTGSQSYWFEIDEWSEFRGSPVYLSTFAEPLQFRLGPVVLSAFELGFGSTLPAYGRTLRIRTTFLRVGVWLDG
ncbi:MAG: hypothetical protein KTR31_33945 [Myxococcales bacterium]|nr:hypothetical protein [Myxococcales bacterium]